MLDVFVVYIGHFLLYIFDVIFSQKMIFFKFVFNLWNEVY